MAAPKGNNYWKQANGFAVGREKKYSPETLWAKAVEYFEWVEAYPIKDKTVSCGKVIDIEKPRAMTAKAFCLYAGIDTSTLRNYEKEEAYLPIITRIKDIIYCQKFEGAAVGIFNGNIIAKELGLNDKTPEDVGFDPTQPIEVIFGQGNMNVPRKKSK